MLARLFPAASDTPVEHAWAGVLAVPRDWCATVGLDRGTGLAWAGGYVGHGLTSTNLAGRTLSDLVLERRTELTDLPWVGRRVRRWEPEPARWIAVRGLYKAYGVADEREASSGTSRTSRIASVADRITGR
jgi:glycine/D-amino acid oxidase-like deaminating enzyme